VRKYPAQQAALEELGALAAQAAERTWSGPGAEGLATHEEFLAGWLERLDQLEQELAPQMPELDARRRLREVSCDGVAAAGPAGSARVEYVRFQPTDFSAAVATMPAGEGPPARYLAFVLPAGRPDGLRLLDLGESEPTDQLLGRTLLGLLQDDRRP